MQQVAVVLLTASLIVGCRPSYIDVGAGAKPPEGLVISVVAVRPAGRGELEIELEIRNASARPFSYTGYSTAQPVFVYEYLSDVAWVRPVYLMCGYGLQTVTLAPGDSISTTARVYARNRLQRLRVGIRSVDHDFVLWSTVIDPVTLKAGSRPSLK